VVDDAIVVIENVQRHLSGREVIPERSELTEPDPYAPDVITVEKSIVATGKETTSSDPHAATSIAMAEVTSAVIATSLVLISVFIPVSFFPGTTGILYKQFSLTIAFSIAISAFNALTLSPALAALLLRGEEQKYSVLDWTRISWLSRGYKSVSHVIDNAIHGVGIAYGKAISKVLNFRYAMIVLFLPGLAATGYMYVHVR